MTPQGKAKELFDKFRSEFSWVEKDYTIDLYRDVRQCALTAVDEIIEVLIKVCPNYAMNSYWHPIDYWQQVKQEINSL